MTGGKRWKNRSLAAFFIFLLPKKFHKTNPGMADEESDGPKLLFEAKLPS